jgi:hypothetical protein
MKPFVPVMAGAVLALGLAGCGDGPTAPETRAVPSGPRAANEIITLANQVIAALRS